jgi:hypothetical protein
VYRSEDGGRTFRTLPTGPTYDVGLKGDHHAFWLNPKDSRHAFLGGDGGLHETWDLGETWVRLNNLPIGQFYSVAADDRDPYWIYGGMQDNHSWMGPSATRHWLGIVNEDWRQIGFGDGMYQRPDPFNKRWVYTASQNLGIQRFDIETGDRLGLKPFPPAEGDTAYRFDWTAPIIVSRHTPGTVYVGGNRLFTTRDYGNSWTRSPDLTRRVNRDTLPIMGVLGRDVTLSRYDGESSYSEMSTISESPLDAKVLWVGTDDGVVQVSRDAGVTWTDVTAALPGVPVGTLVSRVHASSLGRGAAYVSFDGHRGGDYRPHLFRTLDFGATWTRVVGNLPDDMPVRTVHEYDGKPGVVFAGMEFGLYLSVDTARTWTRVASLPTTRYDDILVHPKTKDVIVGTHGRSIWILDDAAPIADFSPAVATKRVHLFPVRAATLFQFWEDFSYRAQGAFAGENPKDGALVSYHLGRAASKVTVTITTPAGRPVRTLTGPTSPGAIHRINWDLRHAPPPPSGQGGRRGGGDVRVAPAPATRHGRPRAVRRARELHGHDRRRRREDVAHGGRAPRPAAAGDRGTAPHARELPARGERDATECGRGGRAHDRVAPPAGGAPRVGGRRERGAPLHRQHAHATDGAGTHGARRAGSAARTGVRAGGRVQRAGGATGEPASPHQDAPRAVCHHQGDPGARPAAAGGAGGQGRRLQD